MATIAQYHDLPEVYVNVQDLPYKDKYQIIYDYTMDGYRRNLYVLKNWTLEKPKPFITVQEYLKLSSDQKESYGTILHHGGDYLYYKIERFSGYSIKENPPIPVGQKQVQSSLIRRKGLSSINPQTLLTGDIDLNRKSQPRVPRTVQAMPVLTQETAGPYYSQKRAKAQPQLGVMVSLANHHLFHQIIRSFDAIADLIRSTRVDGVNIEQFVVLVNPASLVPLMAALKPIVLDIKMVRPNQVAPPDFYRPARKAWSIPTRTI